MRRRCDNRWLACVATTWLVVLWPCATRGQTPVPPPGAEQRLAELAERFTETPAPAGAAAGAPGPASTPALPAPSEAVAAAGPGVALTTDTAAVASPVKPVADAPAREGSAAPIEQRRLGGGSPSPDAGGGLAEPSGGWTLSTLAALGVVIALIFAARWVYARLGGRVIARSSPAVEVLSRTSVAPKNQVLLLRIGQRVLVVGDSSSGLRTLADLDDPEEVAALLQTVTAAQQDSVTKTFGGLVSRFSGDYGSVAHHMEEGGDGSEFRVDRARDTLSGLASRLRAIADRGPVAPAGEARGGSA